MSRLERNGRICSFTLILLLIFLLGPSVYGDQLKVCQNGCEFSSIAAAVAEAYPGDTVYIQADTYEETITLDKGVSLVGGEGGEVVLKPDLKGRPVITVFPSDEIASITGLTVSGAAGEADNREKGVFSDGIALRGDAKLELTDLIVVGNEGCGIRALDASRAEISSSSISNNGRGCCFFNESSGVIYDSRVSGNGIFLEDFAAVAITDSTISNHNQIGLRLSGFSRVKIQGSKIGTSETGVLLTDGSALEMSDSRVADAGDGIRVEDDGGVEIIGSKFSDCTSAIEARNNGGISVVRTRIVSNDHGLSLFDNAELSLREPRIAYNDIGIRADTRSSVTVDGCGVKFFNNFERNTRGLDQVVGERVQDRCK